MWHSIVVITLRILGIIFKVKKEKLETVIKFVPQFQKGYVN